MTTSPVFEETYQQYLLKIRQIDYLAQAEPLGAEKQGDCLVIPLYDTKHRVSRDGIETVDGQKVAPAVRVILSKYVLMSCEDTPLPADDVLMTFRDFKDGSPLISYFTTNTNKILETTFAGNLEGLRQSAIAIGGAQQSLEGYDCSVLFYALPRVPVIVNFNDKDEMFPAVCSVLYRASAECFLDMECLAMTGTLLAGKLLTGHINP